MEHIILVFDPLPWKDTIRERKSILKYTILGADPLPIEDNDEGKTYFNIINCQTLLEGDNSREKKYP